MTFGACFVFNAHARDPQQSRTDAELISALRRAWLLPQVGVVDPAAEAKFSLDSVVGDEGGNFSAGERQLLALCRALVKDSKVIVLASPARRRAMIWLILVAAGRGNQQRRCRDRLETTDHYSDGVFIFDLALYRPSAEHYRSASFFSCSKRSFLASQ